MLLLDTISATNTQAAADGTLKVGSDWMSLLSKINWHAPSWDLFIVLFFLVTVFLYGMSLGRDRVIVILVSIYMALAVVTNAPILNDPGTRVNVGDLFAFKTATFLGVFVGLFFLLTRSALMRAFGGLASGKWWQVMLFSTFHVGLLVSVTLSFLPQDAVASLAPLTQKVFASEGGKFFWIIAPVCAMVFIKGDDR